MRLLFALLVMLAASLPVSALPTPGLFCEPADSARGRVFPEATETNDFVGYDEAICGLQFLLAENPDRMKIDVVTQSVGWARLTGGHDTFDVFVVRVSDYTSALDEAEKIRLVFQLSIHGNEKGGREGGLRVIEDFARGIGFVEEHPELQDYLQYMEVLFVFPNPDGWTHEEAEYRANDACYFSATCTPGQPGLETQNFVRVNGNGVDVNREWPTVGWVRDFHTPLSEPEAIGLVDYLRRETNVKYASDIHGMLNPADGNAGGCAFGVLGLPGNPTGFDPTCMQSAVDEARGHYVLTMLPAGRQDPVEMERNTALAEFVKETLNGDPYFAEWQNLPNSAGGAWGGEFNDWGTVWDTIGYTDSGFTSDWYALDIGLNAAGVDFELSYNHVTFDNYYPGVAQRMNDYHVRIVRDIVWTFMAQAAKDVDATVDTKGTKTAWLSNPLVLTNEGDLSVTGWGLENSADDAIDTAHRVYRAAPDDYFLDLERLVGRQALQEITSADLPQLAGYDNLVVAGSAYRTLDAAGIAAIKAWVEAGGDLFVTDEALQLLVDLGVASAGSVEMAPQYAGATNFVDREHPLAANIRGLGRMTYEPVPVGYSIENGGISPVWSVAAADFSGDVVGLSGIDQGFDPDPERVNLGRAALGKGTASFLGALLPDPVNDGSAYYGVDSYSTTYTGNQILRNALGWELTVVDAAVDPADPWAGNRGPMAGGEEPATEQGTPMVGPVLFVTSLTMLAALLRRRRP
ncbi:MAG: M14 family zinc carboxypeptidase [Methanobacteriota archaeon]